MQTDMHILDDVFKQLQRLAHAIDAHVLQQLLIVLGQRGHKQHGRDTLEAVHPLDGSRSGIRNQESGMDEKKILRIKTKGQESSSRESKSQNLGGMAPAHKGVEEKG